MCCVIIFIIFLILFSFEKNSSSQVNVNNYTIYESAIKNWMTDLIILLLMFKKLLFNLSSKTVYCISFLFLVYKKLDVEKSFQDIIE